MRTTRFYLLGLFILAVLVIGGLKLRQAHQQQLANTAAPGAAPWAVRVVEVTQGRATRGFPALALVKGANEATVAPRLDGIILEMKPREGEVVAAGDLLAQIDTRELNDRLASLEAQRLGASVDAERRARDLRRADELLKDKSISVSEVDQLQAAARGASEQVRSLDKQIAAERTRLGYAQITAPFDGVISARSADPGELAAIGKPLYRLVSTTAGRLEVRLPAEVLERVHPGTEVELTHGGQRLVLHADRIFPSLDERSLGRLEIDVPELPFGAVPGALLRARVITAAIDDTLIVPADTLLPGSDATRGRVLRLSKDASPRIETVPVTIRLRTADGVAVEGDLEPGERLVRAHETTLLRLNDGDPVKVEGPDR